MGTVLCQGILVLTHAAEQGENATLDGLDTGLHNLAELLSNSSGSLSERERFGRVQVEEDSGEDQTHDHEHFMLGVDTLGVLRSLQRQAENVRSKVYVCKVSNAVCNVSLGSDLVGGRVKDIWLILLSGDINLVDACDLASLLPEKPDGDILVKLLDMLLPIAVVQRLAHGLTLLTMECTVSRKHEVQSSLTKEETSSLSPGDTEVLGVFQYGLCSHVGGDVDTGRNKGRSIPGEIVMSTEISHDLLHLAWDSHWEMSID